MEERKERKRDVFRSIRKGMSQEEVSEKSDRIRERVENLSEFKVCDNFSSYIAKSSENEVETEELVRKWIGKKKVLVPYVSGGTLKISPIWDFDSDLKTGSFGVLEPRKEIKTNYPPSEVELILVPGLAFDENGNRLGYGGGYYDGLLKKIPDDSTAIGLAYECQIAENVPNDERDEKLDMIVTENRTLNFAEG